MAYYAKLPIVLLSELAAGKEDSNNCRIARCLLERLDCLGDISIEKLAAECFVSKATVSRFCREIGLEDFGELRDLMRQAEKTFTLYGHGLPPKEQGLDFCGRVQESLELVAESLDYEALGRLAEEIKGAKRVAAFGLLKAESAAISLQSDLTMLGKNAVTKVAFREQIDFLSAAGPEDLVVIFSYTGICFDYGLPRHILREGPKVWLVTGCPDIRERFAQKGLPAHRLLTFRSEQDFVSHPYQLQMAASLIAQRLGAVSPFRKR
ncbi:MurR/RpiR family transcriptional regulator [Oscillospiraceae bacterium 21-37]